MTNETCPELVEEIKALANALISLAETAGVPDSYMETDSRIVLAREALERYGEES